MEGPETDGELGQLDIGRLSAAYASGSAPGQELGISRNVGNEVEKLPGRKAHNTPLGMTRNHAALNPSDVWPNARPDARHGPAAGGRNPRRRDSSSASMARPRPSGSPWRAPARQARRTRPASRS